MKDPNAPHPRPFYTPIAHIGNGYYLEPVAIGMKFAGNFAGAKLCKLDFDPGGVNATAYAAVMPNGQQAVAIINKDDKPLPIDLGEFALALMMSAPSLDSTKVELTEPARYKELSVVPPATAVLLRKVRE